jgi:hypothetical protein
MKRFGREVWIGLTDIQPRPGNEVFNDAPGAIANFVALAEDIEDAIRVATSHFDQLGFDVKALDDLEMLEDRLDAYDVSDEILDLVTKLSRKTLVLKSTFHIYETEEE